MKVIVTGLECSGTKWVTTLLSKHPNVEEVFHRSIPEFGMPDTRWPDLNGADAIVWVIRYEQFRLISLARMGYAIGRTREFAIPAVYFQCHRVYFERHNQIQFVSYESLVGPLGILVWCDLLNRIGLSSDSYPAFLFDSKDGNEKYLNREQSKLGTINNACQTTKSE